MHWFLDPIWDHYIDFEGRTARKPFWMFILFYFIAAIVVSLMAQMLDMMLLVHLFTLALLLPTISITARRLHDIGMSGWWQLLGLIPVIGWIIVIVLNARPGQEGANEYGSDPLAGAGAADTQTQAAQPNPMGESSMPDTDTPADSQ